MSVVLTALLLVAPARDACTPPKRGADAGLVKSAKGARDNPAAAADKWLEAAHLFPPCLKTYRRRIDHVLRSLDALSGIPRSSAALCDDPDVRAASLIRKTRAELDALPGSKEVDIARADLDARAAALPEPARKTAELLDPDMPPSAPAVTLDLYSRSVTAFGSCPTTRAALVRDILAVLPATPKPPACDERTAAARRILRDALAALEKTESGAETPEHKALQQRLAQLDTEGDALAAIRARATAATTLDAKAEIWAELARGLPTCSVHLKAKHDAALAAIAAWNDVGEHRHPPADRYTRAHSLLSGLLTTIDTDYGERAAALPERTSLASALAALKAPDAPRVIPPPPPPKEDRWIFRLRPERNVVELGLVAGLEFPAPSHELFDPYMQRDSNDAFWRPYRRVNGAYGLRLAWYPLRFLGAEVEGGVMPTRVLEGANESPGERALLYAFRGHLVGQLPWWRITPFITFGPGLLGTTGALGDDVDFALNIGGGVKAFLTRWLMLRLDVREVRSFRLRIDNGGANYPEVLLGLSWTFNRRPSAPAPAKRPVKGK